MGVEKRSWEKEEGWTGMSLEIMGDKRMQEGRLMDMVLIL